jgi:hypothetical protein
MAVVTNDIYTREDAEALVRMQALHVRPDHRGGNRRLSAHGHPRGRLDQSAGHRRGSTIGTPIWMWC